MEGSSPSSSSSGANSAESHGEANGSASSSRTKLNLHASEWSLAENRSPEELRSLFITFSKQQPLDEREITWFFNHNYGRCVQKIILFPKDQSNPPVCGKALFRFASVPAAVLGKELDEARFWVNGKPLWCRRYEPRKNCKNQETKV